MCDGTPDCPEEEDEGFCTSFGLGPDSVFVSGSGSGSGSGSDSELPSCGMCALSVIIVDVHNLINTQLEETPPSVCFIPSPNLYMCVFALYVLTYCVSDDLIDSLPPP